VGVATRTLGYSIYHASIALIGALKVVLKI